MHRTEKHKQIESAHFAAIIFVTFLLQTVRILPQYFNAGDLSTLTSCRLGTRSRTSASFHLRC